ncbi:MAG: FtsB family cell division protein [Atopobiaceae bacterium]
MDAHSSQQAEKAQADGAKAAGGKAVVTRRDPKAPTSTKPHKRVGSTPDEPWRMRDISADETTRLPRIDESGKIARPQSAARTGAGSNAFKLPRLFGKSKQDEAAERQRALSELKNRRVKVVSASTQEELSKEAAKKSTAGREAEVQKAGAQEAVAYRTAARTTAANRAANTSEASTNFSPTSVAASSASPAGKAASDEDAQAAGSKAAADNASTSANADLRDAEDAAGTRKRDRASQGARSALDVASRVIFEIKAAPGRAADLVRTHRVVSAAALVVLVIVVAVWGPTKNYYVAWRQSQELAQKYDELNTDNQQLTDEVDRLQTREGIEEEARRQGYAKEGETTVRIEGSTSQDADSSDGSSSGADADSSSDASGDAASEDSSDDSQNAGTDEGADSADAESTPAEDKKTPWYVPIGDFLFNYHSIAENNS